MIVGPEWPLPKPQPQGAAQVLEDHKELDLGDEIGGHLQRGVKLIPEDWWVDATTVGLLGINVDWVDGGLGCTKGALKVH